MEQNIFWDKKITRQEAAKILGDSQHDRFPEMAALLLSRTNNAKLVFSDYLAREVFCRQWKRIKYEMRRNKWADQRIDFWEQVHKVVYKQIGQKIAIQKKQAPPKVSEFGGIARVLRSERKKQDITQKALARKTGVSQQTISHVENGMGDVSFGTLKKISTALNLEFKIGPKE